MTRAAPSEQVIPAPSAPIDVPESSLRHLMVVGGTFREWFDLGARRWERRVDELGMVVAAAGGAWLTLRAYEIGDDPVDLHAWSRVVNGIAGDCTVIVDPCADGRRRFADAMASLDARTEVNEVTVASALYDPADCEPDVVLILGPDTQLPPSLVWELAYAELVFVDTSWDALAAPHLVSAVSDFAGRRRRFGGLDP